jgi:hypothetical protein
LDEYVGIFPWIHPCSSATAAAGSFDDAKWVVELERIMDEKLEGDLAKQACRTYFVTRMSVAFDDLKWNAKAADNLFRRAQTMPASEAKVWKKAFEALLKKEIGQTATTYKDDDDGATVVHARLLSKTAYESADCTAHELHA